LLERLTYFMPVTLYMKTGFKASFVFLCNKEELFRVNQVRAIGGHCV